MITIGILVFPQVEELDFIGPYEILSYSSKIKPDSVQVLLVGTETEVRAFNGLRMLPDVLLEECPSLDILVVPGGKGRMQAMQDARILDFIREQDKGTQYTTSVCTGAFLLANAGLLSGKTATTYHTALEELAGYGVEIQKAKVVQDGKIITGAGVSSGIELGLYLLKLLFGLDFAQEVARKVEYEVDVENLSLESKNN